MLWSPSVETVVIFLQHPNILLWTTTGPISKIHTTIGLRVSFLFVCEIAVHSVPTCPEECTFVDHKGLNDRLTSTELTPRCSGIRNDVIQRDGYAYDFSQIAGQHCDPAHLIPRSKGEKVWFVVSSYNYSMKLFSSALQKWYNVVLPELTWH